MKKVSGLSTLSLMVMITCLLLSSCAKNPQDGHIDPGIQVAPPEMPAILDDNRYTGAANPDNPYDRTGYWHNRALDYLEGCMPDTGQPGLEKLTGCIIEMDGLLPGGTIQEPSFYENIPELIADWEHDFTHVIDGLPYSENARTWLKELMVEIRESYVLNDYSFDGIRDRVVEMEQVLLTGDGYSESEKRMLLQAASIARYSANYWQHNPPVEGRLSWKGILARFAGVTADIEGFLITLDLGISSGCSKWARWATVYGMP